MLRSVSLGPGSENNLESSRVKEKEDQNLDFNGLRW